MRKILVLLVFSFSAIIVHAQDAETGTSTYYLIRHSEKVASPDSDPALKVEGVMRAERWAVVFINIPFDAIYSTDYKRTRSTANPTAVSQDLEVTLYDPRQIDYEEFMQKTRGQTVLIVGHSNTTPLFVNKLLGKEEYKSIEHNVHGNLYIVEISASNTTDKLLSIE